MIVYAIWIGILGWKFQWEEQSPFDTQGFFCFVSPLSLCITILAYLILFDAKNTLKCSDMARKILTGVFYFTCILAHLSLVLLYFIPPKLNWLGYSIVSGVFLVMVAYTFLDHMMMLGMKISEIWVRIKGIKENKTLLRTTPSF